MAEPPPYTSPFTDEIDSIPDDDIVLRRVPPQHVDWSQLDSAGHPRITRGAFQDYPTEKAREYGLPAPCMSVMLLSVLEEKKVDPASILARFGPAHGFAQLTAGEFRRCRQGIQSNPTPDDPWHAVVFSVTTEKKTRAMMGELAEAARWLRAPTERPH